VDEGKLTSALDLISHDLKVVPGPRGGNQELRRGSQGQGERNMQEKILTRNAQRLRKNMTKEERGLWYTFLRSLSFTFNRQKVLCGYIVDFYCAEKKVVIELDGSQHYEDEGQYKDKLRDETLKGEGIKVLRYSNYEINFRFREVCEDIFLHLTAKK
jgi:very-short-patch-repair endonuclease